MVPLKRSNVIVGLFRHSNRKKVKNPKDNPKIELTQEGVKNAKLVANQIPRGHNLKVYYSPTKRTQDSAGIARQAHISKGGKAYLIRTKAGLKGKRVELGIGLFENIKLIGSRNRELKDTKLVVREWLDGKWDKYGVTPPVKVADIVIKKILRGPLRIKTSKKNIFILNDSHEWILMAVFERLLGKKYSDFGLDVPSFNEGIVFDISSKGKVKLKVSNKIFDVTKKVNSIVGK